MNPSRQRTIGLPLGLASLAVCGVILIAWFSLSRPVAPTPPAPPSSTQGEAPDLQDPATRAFRSRLAAVAPAASATLEAELARARATDTPHQDQAQIVVRAAFAQFQDQALAMRSAATPGYDQLLGHVRSGLAALQASQSNWCKAHRIEALLRQPTPDLVEQVLSQFAYGTPQYDWLMQWGTLYLEAARQARTEPVRHGPRTARDKRVLQDYGRQLAAREWQLALQIAAFSQAEGQGYDTMRETIAGIDVCRLGITAIDLSAQLPEPVRGRIWAELLPELMYGNTPYALYLVTGYFFLD